MIKKLIVALFLISIIPIWVACGGLPKSAVAEVDGKVITREDLDSAISDLKKQYQGQQGFPQPDSPQYADLQKQVAERLASEEVLWFEADAMGISVSDEDINAQIDQYKQMSGGEDKFNDLLNQQGITLDHLKDVTRKSLLFQKLYAEVTKDAPEVTDDQALQYFNQNKSQFQKPETRKVSHILVADEATAKNIKAQLEAGADFATLAKQNSTDPGSKDKGGDLGDVPSTGSGFAPEFEKAMDSLAAGQTSDPVKTQFGYHIIRVISITPAGQQTFDQVKDELKNGLLLENQRTVFDKWLEDAKGRHTIVYAEEFQPAATTATQSPTSGEAAPAPQAAPVP